mmetsp:Transcript_5511/g.8558  ORF Transcript_5511/g.8558 Transcript_5511/m.8558 type:complete len:196 (-) Transcript_5511:61-648(-)
MLGLNPATAGDPSDIPRAAENLVSVCRSNSIPHISFLSLSDGAPVSESRLLSFRKAEQILESATSSSPDLTCSVFRIPLIRVGAQGPAEFLKATLLRAAKVVRLSSSPWNDVCSLREVVWCVRNDLEARIMAKMAQQGQGIPKHVQGGPQMAQGEPQQQVQGEPQQAQAQGEPQQEDLLPNYLLYEAPQIRQSAR